VFTSCTWLPAAFTSSTPGQHVAAGSNSQRQLNRLLQRYSAQLLAQVPFDTLQAQVSCCYLHIITAEKDPSTHSIHGQPGDIYSYASCSASHDTAGTGKLHL
jgi:hypothetical protein